LRSRERAIRRAVLLRVAAPSRVATILMLVLHCAMLCCHMPPPADFLHHDVIALRCHTRHAAAAAAGFDFR